MTVRELRRMRYVGPSRVLYGKTALAKDHDVAGLVEVQFDDASLGTRAYGWTVMPIRDFEPLPDDDEQDNA